MTAQSLFVARNVLRRMLSDEELNLRGDEIPAVQDVIAFIDKLADSDQSSASFNDGVMWFESGESVIIRKDEPKWEVKHG